jgi:predicted LPLAT superfamily acyltransferase
VSERWQELPEKGSALAIRLVVGALGMLGRRAGAILLRLVAAWYVFFHPAVRRTSRAFLKRVGQRGRIGEVLHHVFTFAQVTADRVFLLRGEVSRFRVERLGGEPLLEHVREGRGALLVLAHLGSWEVLRINSREGKFKVSVLAYYENSRGVTEALRALDPTASTELIEIRRGDPSFVFEVEERIRRGEVVGTMGDRVGLDGKAVTVPFMGSLAPFPTGPYRLAGLLRCPVFLGFGIYEAPDRYLVRYEPFAERIELPRGKEREEALRALAARYAARLEEHCRAHPDNWFNFFDFWKAA